MFFIVCRCPDIQNSKSSGDTVADVTKAGADTTKMNTGGRDSDDAGTGHVNAADAVKTTASTSNMDTGMADTANNNVFSIITDTSDIKKNHLGIFNLDRSCYSISSTSLL